VAAVHSRYCSGLPHRRSGYWCSQWGQPHHVSAWMGACWLAFCIVHDAAMLANWLVVRKDLGHQTTCCCRLPLPLPLPQDTVCAFSTELASATATCASTCPAPQTCRAWSKGMQACAGKGTVSWRRRSAGASGGKWRQAARQQAGSPAEGASSLPSACSDVRQPLSARSFKNEAWLRGAAVRRLPAVRAAGAVVPDQARSMGMWFRTQKYELERAIVE